MDYFSKTAAHFVTVHTGLCIYCKIRKKMNSNTSSVQDLYQLNPLLFSKVPAIFSVYRIIPVSMHAQVTSAHRVDRNRILGHKYTGGITPVKGILFPFCILSVILSPSEGPQTRASSIMDYSHIPAISERCSVILIFCGQCFSHCLHLIQSDAFP